jgi:class 3 adenylate cyclase
LARARLLPAQVEVALALGDRGLAETSADELAAIAGSYDTDALHASAAYSRASIALAHGDHEAAARCAEEARRRWQQIDLPYEAAKARVIMGEALALGGEKDAAGLELRAAQSAFTNLGARRDTVDANQRLARLSNNVRKPGEPEVGRSFMFTDVVSSTDLIGVIGDDSWAAARGWHDRTLRSLFAAHKGDEVSHAGDGFFVVFAEPDAALKCAIEIQRALEAHRSEHGFSLPVRIGVHHACAAPTPDGYAGQGVHVAARVGALAGAGEIVVSAEALAKCEEAFPAGLPREASLKGLQKPIDVVTLQWR